MAFARCTTQVALLILLLFGYMTAFSTCTIPIAMDLGGCNQKELIKMGWLPSIIFAVCAVFGIMTVNPVITG